jgi:hypothetical protein
MWSFRCAVAGHDDRFSRTTNRLALKCIACGRTTRGWLVGTTKEEPPMDKWSVIAAVIPTSGVFAWGVVRFMEWRKRLRGSMWGHAQGES